MTFSIPGRLPTRNESDNLARANRIAAARERAKHEELIMLCARRDLGRYKPSLPVVLHYHFFEQNKRRDKDNVASEAMKLVQDSLVKMRYLPDDGWAEIEGFTCVFSVDKKNPRIEVDIEEVVNHD